MTPSEKFVSDLCLKSFLPFWSFQSPLGKKTKELCDILVLCNDIIIIISVKDISPSTNSEESINYERWVKKAIYDSSEQICGAERYLNTVDEIVLNDRKTTVKLPEKSKRKIYRIAVAFGSKPNYPLPTGDFGNGFVHVFDELSTSVIFNELDTIKDFINYLDAKENFFLNKTFFIPREVDFLALYIENSLDFNLPYDTIVAEYGMWESYCKSKPYLQWQKEIQPSFIWDNLINHLYKHHIKPDTSVEKREELELAVRQMNLEPRINRIELVMVLENAIKNKVSARMLKPLPGNKYTYVFIPLTNKNWNKKEKELQLRCVVARVVNPDVETIIGISLGGGFKGKESVFDVCFLHVPIIDDDFVKNAKEIQSNLGYFTNTKLSYSKDFRTH
ncbi:hypothetical protein RCC89_13405 [Cytophagaceae bacterium ABcell3]|nr:hypothetical protein RCC89_13405 [Cytophagaceae bacterium ABcell3]